MRPRVLRRLLPVVAALVVAATATLPPSGAAAASAPRFGIFTTDGSPESDAVVAGLREGFRLAAVEPRLLERVGGADDATARTSVAEFDFDNVDVDVVFAVGPRAAQLARDALRRRPVVFVGVGYPEALGLPGRGNVCGVADGPAAAAVVDWVRGAAPRLATLGVVVPEDAQGRRAAADVAERAGSDGVATVSAALRPGTAGDRADAVLAELLPRADAIWMPATVDDAAADALARALRGRGIPLLGARRGQLDAGAAAVLYTDPRTCGLAAAALAERLRAGEVPSDVGVRRPARRLSAVSLNAARLLGHEVPLPFAAAADLLLPALGGRR